MECCTRTPSFVRGRSDEEGRAGKKTRKQGRGCSLYGTDLFRVSCAAAGRQKGGVGEENWGRWMEVSKHRVIIRKRRWKWMGLSSGPILYVARNSSWCMERTSTDNRRTRRPWHIEPSPARTTPRHLCAGACSNTAGTALSQGLPDGATPPRRWRRQASVHLRIAGRGGTTRRDGRR